MTPEGPPRTGREVEIHRTDLEFAMLANGYRKQDDRFELDPDSASRRVSQFGALQVAMFGPNALTITKRFFYPRQEEVPLLVTSLAQPEVLGTISKYRSLDLELGERVSYLFGGTARQMKKDFSYEEIKKRMQFMARIISLGERRSGEAIAVPTALYTYSGGSRRDDTEYRRKVYGMADAIIKDPVTVAQTQDLGLSQALRLRAFVDDNEGTPPRDIPDLDEALRSFDGFPTVGAEFHLPLKDPERSRSFWKRISLLNMSAYQRGNYVQMSRNDRGVIEIRMNPSYYPITIANWNYMRHVLPELQQAFFTITFNKSTADGNFDWQNGEHRKFLNKLKGLGMLAYASVYSSVPRKNEQEDSDVEIDFGKIYLGQTVKMSHGAYEFTGDWAGGNETMNGQLGMYFGFGPNLPYLAYYGSMAIAEPAILEGSAQALREVHTLRDALLLGPYERKNVIGGSIKGAIDQDLRLRQATKAGVEIRKLLDP